MHQRLLMRFRAADYVGRRECVAKPKVTSTPTIALQAGEFRCKGQFRCKGLCNRIEFADRGIRTYGDSSTEE
jgi:hypothetical protein